MIKIKIDNYITEKNNKIADEILFEVLDKKQKILLNSPMKTGKTTFTMNYLPSILMPSDIQEIFVTPIKSLMNDIKNKYPRTIKCNGNVSEIKLNNNVPILTTPESMHKVIKACEDENKRFFIVYDEIHQIIINAGFREKLKNPLLYYEHELCIGLLGMTATPEPLENIDFDKRFEIVVKNKFVQANKTIILKNFTKNPDNMLNFIKYMKNNNNNKLIIARINNKDDIKLIKPKLKNCVAWYRSKNERKEDKEYLSDMELMEDVLSGEDIKNIDYLLCTSLVDVGVEIQLKEKPIVIDFIDSTSSIIDDIQFVGRFRQGIEQLYLVGKLNKENPNTKPLNFAKEYNKRFEINKNLIAVLNDYGDEEKTKTHLTTESIRFNSDNGKYELDEYGLMQSIFKKYINFFLQTEIYLKLFLEQHQTFNTNLISIDDYNGLDIIKTTELKEEKKKIKENIKQHEKEFYDEINSLDLDNEILKMILNYEEIEQQDIWKIKNYEYLCNKWKDECLEEYRERYKQVSEKLKNIKIKEIEKLKISLIKKEVSKLIKQINYINYNLLYNKDRKLKAINKNMLIVFRIRDFINKIKGKERDVYLSNKFKLELLEQLKKEKSLSKLTPISLDKHLKLIYNISVNKQKRNIITSIKTNI